MMEKKHGLKQPNFVMLAGTTSAFWVKKLELSRQENKLKSN